MLGYSSGSCFIRLLVLCALSIYYLPLSAKEIEHKLPSGIIISAEYHSGDPAKPAVLLLHAYLQTRNFPLIYNLSNSLSGEGYSTLTPTLSLGVTHRSQSLACEAIHTHSLHDDVEEARYWVNWLVSKGHKKIVLIGHSFAAIQLMDYAQSHPSGFVRKMIFISASDVEHNFSKKGRVDRRNSVELAAKDQKALASFELGFCNDYRSTAPAYLSYISWTQERVLKTLPKLKIPYIAIFGDADTLVSKEWPSQIRKAGGNVFMISHASHFFDDSNAEFDLIEYVSNQLKLIPDQ